MLVDPAWEVGGADLVWRAGVYYLHVTQSREAPDEHEPDGGTLGVDLGITNLATDSEGERFTGAVIRIVRGRYHLRRQRLQNVRHDATRSVVCAAWDSVKRASKPTRTTASARGSSRKPPYRARQSLSKT